MSFCLAFCYPCLIYIYTHYSLKVWFIFMFKFHNFPKWCKVAQRQHQKGKREKAPEKSRHFRFSGFIEWCYPHEIVPSARAWPQETSLVTSSDALTFYASSKTPSCELANGNACSLNHVLVLCSDHWLRDKVWLVLLWSSRWLNHSSC